MIKERIDEFSSNEDINTEDSFNSDEDMQAKENLDDTVLEKKMYIGESENLNEEVEPKGDLKDVSNISDEVSESSVRDECLNDHNTIEDQEKEKENLIDQYLDKADSEEEIDIANSFELSEFEYRLKKFDIAVQEYEQCKDSLDDYGYIFLSEEDDRKSKYFADQLLWNIDRFGKMQKSELIFCENQNIDSKNDFIDLKNYFINSIEEKLLVLDLCKFGHIEKEYFLNSFYDFMKKDGNKIKFRELLAKKQIKLLITVFDKDIEKKDNLFNVYKVKEDFSNNEQESQKRNGQTKISVSEFLSDLNYNTIEKALLFIVSLFKGCTPIELQNMLYLILDEEETVRWKKERKKLLANMHIVSKSEFGSGTIMEFNESLKGHESELLEILRAEDPFFVLEFFDLFEGEKELFTEVLTGKKSQDFTNGFFQLIKVVSLDEPDRLSLNWFIDKFENNKDFSIDYFFALASCALQVSKALNDHTFLDNLVSYFYKQKALLPLLYLLEYFTYIEMFDKYKWYKEILSLLNDDPNRGKIFSLLYKAIQKEVYADSQTINIVLSWRGNDKVINGYIFKILTRLASDTVKDNKDWNSENNRVLPFLFTFNENNTSNRNMGYYFEYLFNFKEISKNCDDVIVLESIAENINKLFFTKIIGLLRLYFSKSEQKSIVKNISRDIQKLIGEAEKTYILYKILLILEWNFLLNYNMDVDCATVSKRNLFSLYLDKTTRNELREIRNLSQVLSNLFLKLSSQTRKNRQLSNKYTMLRKDLRNVTQNMNKKTKEEEK